MTQDHEKYTPLAHMFATGGIFLEGNWTVTYEGRAVGKCRIQKNGLYYHFNCRCELVSHQVCRLQVSCAGKRTDIGVLIPSDNCILLEKRIAAKHFQVGQPELTLMVSGEIGIEECFIPVREDVPMPCLQLLQKARFAVRDGVPGILITEKGCF